MKVTIKCTAVKGDPWASFKIKVEGACKAFDAHQEIKRFDNAFTEGLQFKGSQNGYNYYDLNRIPLNKIPGKVLYERVDELISYLLDRNTALQEQYPEENFTISKEVV